MFILLVVVLAFIDLCCSHLERTNIKCMMLWILLYAQVMLGLVVAAYAIGYFHTGTLLGMGEFGISGLFFLGFWGPR